MVVRKYSTSEEQFFRSITPPFEDWLSTRIPPQMLKGGVRWFRSANVHAIENYQRVRIQVATPTKRAG
jgi:hypothetical protein